MAFELVRPSPALKPGDHVCSIYQSVAERLVVAVGFVQQGLAGGDRCLYLADETSGNDFVANVAGAGVDVAHQQERGALQLLSTQELKARFGSFTPRAMLDFLRGQEAAAIASGHLCLRLCAEMPGLLEADDGGEQLIEFEALFDEFLPGSRTIALCQYDQMRVLPSTIEGALRTHPLLILGGQMCVNQFHEAPQVVLGRGSRASRVDWIIDQIQQANVPRRLNEQSRSLLIDSEWDEGMQRVRQQIDRLPLGFVLVDANRRIQYWNPAAEKIFGYSKSEALGQVCSELIQVASSSERDLEPASRVESTETDAPDVHENRRRDGRTIFCEWFSAPLFDAQGQFTGTVSLARDVTGARRDEEVLRKNTERLQTVSRRLLEVQEAERRHLARELHDEFGQVLSMLSVNLDVVRRGCEPGVLSHLDESISIVGLAIQQVHDMALDLRPLMLDDLGLVSTLRWFADRQAQRAGFVLHFVAKSSGRRLPAIEETAGYRIAQEALTNIVRHAGASRVWLSLEEREDEVRLEIRDDGAGFDVASVRERAIRGASLGVLGMQERAELLGGTIKIQSQPGQGTSILARIPLQCCAPL